MLLMLHFFPLPPVNFKSWYGIKLFSSESPPTFRFLTTNAYLLQIFFPDFYNPTLSQCLSNKGPPVTSIYPPSIAYLTVIFSYVSILILTSILHT